LLQDFERFIDQASEDQLNELALAYEEIRRREDSSRISRWIDDCDANRNDKSYKAYWFSAKVGQLLRLFEHLAGKGIPPFKSREAQYLVEVKKPDWNNLPKRLHYLIPAAERLLTGESAGMKAVRLAIQQLARTDSTVLILGETGTGKELVARAIHQLSPRRDRLLVSISCAALG